MDSDLEQKIKEEKRSFTKTTFSYMIIYIPIAMICALMEDSGFGKQDSNVAISLLKLFVFVFFSIVFLQMYKSESLNYKYFHNDPNYKKGPFKIHIFLLVIGISTLLYPIKLLIFIIALGVLGKFGILEPIMKLLVG
ncbi:hypothetical protein V6Z05_19965 [Leptospira venezuelensis]|uniref:hypothetical protein n=1 Tax=Leptospira venezuelensis TaxID=1958811 RepID=UPI000A38D70B|nr:hypothetical protein [Leptospira venezuelensis]